MLALWFLDLILLRLCSYKGAYANRLHLNRWVGTVEPMPYQLTADVSVRTKQKATISQASVGLMLQLWPGYVVQDSGTATPVANRPAKRLWPAQGF